MEETSRRSFLGRHQSCYCEKIEILSDSIECNHPSRNTSSLLYSEKLLGWKLEKSYARKVYMSPRPPPKISLKHDWKRELGSEGAQRPAGPVVQQFKSSQSNQPTPSPDHDITGKPVVCPQRGHPVLRKSKHVLFMKKLLNMIER